MTATPEGGVESEEDEVKVEVETDDDGDDDNGELLLCLCGGAPPSPPPSSLRQSIEEARAFYCGSKEKDAKAQGERKREKQRGALSNAF